jgi:murein DD-endopeptidase MepM/ murein hydrolase activator NlpD
MTIRTADLDRSKQSPGVTSRLSYAASPLGGSFGKVRSCGHKPHQGWDLYADIGTPVYAIAPGVVEFVQSRGDYGLQLCIRLDEDAMCTASAGFSRVGQLWAFYAHLSLVFFQTGQAVLESDVVALTGNSGNATNVPPHLHFEIRTKPHAAKGLTGRIDPARLLGYDYYMSR